MDVICTMSEQSWQQRTRDLIRGNELAVGLFGLLAVVLIVAGIMSAFGAMPSTTNPPAAVEEGQITEVCHDQVRDQLKAPSTADFGGDVVTGSEPEYQDSGWVDAENSFGAKIRTAYTCTARHTGGVNFQVRATLID